MFSVQVVALLLLLLLVIGPQHVDSFSFVFSDPEQCGPLTITFDGRPSLVDLPLSLTIIPFNSTLPLSIPIPNSAVENAGVSLPFLPYAAGTKLVLSIDDFSNTTEVKVSKEFQIMSSSTGNSSCLSMPTDNTYYTLSDSFSQCGPFNVTYNSSVITQPPTVRVFIPGGPSFLANMTGMPDNGVATYTMSAAYNSSVILLLDDQTYHRQTTPVMNVNGNSTSNKSCIPASLRSNNESSTSGIPSLSKAALAAIVAVTGSVVAIVGLLTLVYILRERQKRRFHYQDDDTDFKGKFRSSAIPQRPSRDDVPFLFRTQSTPNASTKESIWSRNELARSVMSKAAVASLEPRPSSSIYSKFADVNEWATLSEPRKAKLAPDNYRQSRPASLTSLDIEDILNSATIYENDDMSDAASVATRTTYPRANPDQSSILTRLPPRRFNSRGEELERWNKRPDVPSDSDPLARFSQAISLSGVVLQHPPGLPSTLNRAMTLPRAMSASTPILYPQRLSVIVDTPGIRSPITPGTLTNSAGVSPWQRKAIKTPMSDVSGVSKENRQVSKALGGVIQSSWYAI